MRAASGYTAREVLDNIWMNAYELQRQQADLFGQEVLPDLVAQFNQDLTDLSRFQSLRHDSRTNRAIGLLTAVFLAPTIVLAFASIYLTSNSWLTLTLSAAAAIASGAGAYVLWGAFMNRRIKGGQ